MIEHLGDEHPELVPRVERLVDTMPTSYHSAWEAVLEDPDGAQPEAGPDPSSTGAQQPTA